MEETNFDQIFKSYILLPYRPEFLFQKLKDSLKTYHFSIIKESKGEVNINKLKYFFGYIFGYTTNINFNNNVTIAISIDNFKNFIYENCKVDDKLINTKEIIYYLFALDDFRNRLIDAIYNLSFDNLNIDDDNYHKLLQHFLINKPLDKFQSKMNFDNKYFRNWIQKKYIFPRNKFNLDELSEENIKLNNIKYNFYGPNETKFKFSLNKRNGDEKVVLFSPDFLIGKKLLNEYTEKDFQIFNENNICPGLFTYMLRETIKELPYFLDLFPHLNNF